MFTLLVKINDLLNVELILGNKHESVGLETEVHCLFVHYLLILLLDLAVKDSLLSKFFLELLDSLLVLLLPLAFLGGLLNFDDLLLLDFLLFLLELPEELLVGVLFLNLL